MYTPLCALRMFKLTSPFVSVGFELNVQNYDLILGVLYLVLVHARISLMFCVTVELMYAFFVTRISSEQV